MEKKFKRIKISKKYKNKFKKNLNNSPENIILFINLSKIISIFCLTIIFFIIIKKFYKTNIFDNYIHIALNIDNKYIYPCIVYLTSLLDNKADSTFYIIHILTGDNINKDIFYKVNATIEKFAANSANVTFYNMKDQFRKATHGGFISVAAYYRISLSSLLPEVEKIIYTDSDVITFKDLSEMYNIKLGEKIYYCGGLDSGFLVGEIKHYFKINLDKYMNSGILIMNLTAIRKDYVETNLKNFISSHFLNHHEQTAINALYYNNIQVLPYKYSCFAFDSYDKIVTFNNKQNEAYRFDETELKEAFYSPTIIHFPGYIKPWDKKCTNMRKAYWWYYANRSLFYQEILVRYNFSNKEVEEILNQIPKEGSLIKKKINKNKENKRSNNWLKLMIGLIDINLLIYFFYIINLFYIY